MANPAARKTFHIQFEISVEICDLPIANLPPGDLPADDLPPASEGAAGSGGAVFMRHLQQALRKDEAAMQAVIRSQVTGKLQEYVDYMAGQDGRAALLRVAEGLPSARDKRFLRLNRDDFEALTRPLRVDSLRVHLDESCIVEELPPTAEGPTRRVVWRDLLRTGALGRLLRQLSFPLGRPQSPVQTEPSHYLQLGYLTEELDGLHIEGRCTCGQCFTGQAQDETGAVECLWAEFREHYCQYQPR